MYTEITPTTELAPFVAFLDGNTDTPTEQDIQLEYLDGNPKPSPSESPEKVVTYLVEPDSEDLMSGAAGLVTFIVNGIAKTFDTYFDGNLALVENVLGSYHTSGESCDGNQPATTVNLQEMFIRPNTTFQIEQYNFPAQYMAEPKLVYDNVSISVAHDFRIVHGPGTYLIPTQEKWTILAKEWEATHKVDKSIRARDGYVIKGIVEPNTVVDIADIDNYRILESIEQINIGLDKYYWADGTFSYKDGLGFFSPTEEDLGSKRLLVLGLPFNDGLGLVYDYDGNVIGKTIDYYNIISDELTAKKYLDTLDYAYPNPYMQYFEGDYEEYIWPDPNPFPEPRETGPIVYGPQEAYLRKAAYYPYGQPTKYVSYHYNGLLRVEPNTWVYLSWDLNTETYASFKENMRAKLNFYLPDAGGYFNVDYYGKSKEFICSNSVWYGNTVGFGLERADEVGIYLVGTNELITGSNISQKNFEIVDNVYVGYLFDRTILDDYPIYTNGFVQLPNHQEYRLKGIIVKDYEPYWAVLDYIKEDIYKVTKLVNIENIEDLHNKGLFVAIEFNKMLTI